APVPGDRGVESRRWSPREPGPPPPDTARPPPDRAPGRARAASSQPAARAREQRPPGCSYNRYLRGGSSGPAPGRIWYYTVGEERWKSTKSWPVSGVEEERWFLSADRALSRAAPSGSDSDTYEVDFDATTGTPNRWYTQLGGGDVIY